MTLSVLKINSIKLHGLTMCLRYLKKIKLECLHLRIIIFVYVSVCVKL